jgi:hypothetical protein
MELLTLLLEYCTRCTTAGVIIIYTVLIILRDIDQSIGGPESGRRNSAPGAEFFIINFSFFKNSSFPGFQGFISSKRVQGSIQFVDAHHTI